MAFTPIDVTVCVVLSSSALVVFLLGGIRVVVGLAKWMGAIALTFLLYPDALEHAKGMFSKPLYGNILVVVGLFAACFVACAIFAAGLMVATGPLKRSLIDRLFGLVLGLGIGFYVVSIMHIAFVVANNNKEPEWLTKGSTYQLTEKGAKTLQGYMGGAITKLLSKLTKDNDLSKEEAKKVEEKAKALLGEGKEIKDEILNPDAKPADGSTPAATDQPSHMTISGPENEKDSSGSSSSSSSSGSSSSSSGTDTKKP